jgi:hypothetical protein
MIQTARSVRSCHEFRKMTVSAQRNTTGVRRGRVDSTSSQERSLDLGPVQEGEALQLCAIFGVCTTVTGPVVRVGIRAKRAVTAGLMHLHMPGGNRQTRACWRLRCLGSVSPGMVQKSLLEGKSGINDEGYRITRAGEVSLLRRRDRVRKTVPKGMASFALTYP